MTTKKLTLLLIFAVIYLCNSYSMICQEVPTTTTTTRVTLDELLTEYQQPEGKPGTIVYHPGAVQDQSQQREWILQLSREEEISFTCMPDSCLNVVMQKHLRGIKRRPRLSDVLKAMNEQKKPLNRANSQKILAAIVTVGNNIEEKSSNASLADDDLESLREQAQEAELMLKNLQALWSGDDVQATIGRFATIRSNLQARPAVSTIFPVQVNDVKFCPRSATSWNFTFRKLLKIVPVKKISSFFNVLKSKLNAAKAISAVTSIMTVPLFYMVLQDAVSDTRLMHVHYISAISGATSLLLGGLVYCLVHHTIISRAKNTHYAAI